MKLVASLPLVGLTVLLFLFCETGTLGQDQRAEEHFRSARNYQEQNRPLEAVAQYQQVLRLQPENEQASIELAMLLSQMGRKGDAERLCREQLSRNAQFSKLHLTLASFLIPEERYQEASSQIQAFFEKVGGNVSETVAERSYGLYLLGITLIAQKKDEEGEQRLQEVVRLNPQFLEAHMELGELYSQSPQTYEKAVQHFTKVTELKPELAAARQKLGKILLNMDRNQSAVEQLQKAIEVAPSLSEAYFSLATAYRKLGDLKRSQEMMSRFQAIESQKENQRQNRRKALTLYQEGEKHVARGELGEALKLFQQCRELVPERSTFDYIFPPDRGYYGLAFVDLLRGNYREASRNIEKAIQLYPYDPRYCELYAQCLEKLNDYRASIAMIERAIQLNPATASYHNLLGNLLFKVAKYSEAASSYRRAVELEPKNPSYRLNLSSALVKAGNSGKPEAEGTSPQTTGPQLKEE